MDAESFARWTKLEKKPVGGNGIGFIPCGMVVRNEIITVIDVILLRVLVISSLFCGGRSLAADGPVEGFVVAICEECCQF